MGIFSRLFRRSETELISADNVLRAALLGSDSDITPEMAMQIPAFSAAVDFITNTVAMLPVKLYEENPTDRSTNEITSDNRLFLLNDESNDMMTAYDTKCALLRDMLLSGNGFMYINHSGNSVESLHYVNRTDVSVQENSDPVFRSAKLLVGGRTYMPHQFLVLARNSRDGVKGTGAVSEHSTLIATMYNSLKLENAVTKTGGSKKGFLTSDHKIADPAMQKIRAAWERLNNNDKNSVMVLENGMKFQESSATSVEMQLNQNKLTNSSMIAQIFGLSPEVISGKASEAVYMSAVKTAIMPIVDAFTAAINKAMLLEREKPNRYFVLDTTELLRGDMQSRFAAYKTAIEANILQIDEVRYKEDLPPLGFNYIKIGLQDVLLDPKTGTIYTPNTNQTVKFGESVLTEGESGGIIDTEERFNPYHDSKGRFASKNAISLDKSAESDIIKVESDKVTISAIQKPIEQPIEQTHTGKGNPNAILTFDTPLTARQEKLLEALPDYDSRVVVPKVEVNMADLSALTAKTGDEFAMFTKSAERLVIRGNTTRVNIDLEQAKQLAAEGYKWSGHTHPGADMFVLMHSDGDMEILKCFPQKESVIYNSKGQYLTFEKE